MLYVFFLFLESVLFETTIFKLEEYLERCLLPKVNRCRYVLYIWFVYCSW